MYRREQIACVLSHVAKCGVRSPFVHAIQLRGFYRFSVSRDARSKGRPISATHDGRNSSSCASFCLFLFNHEWALSLYSRLRPHTMTQLHYSLHLEPASGHHQTLTLDIPEDLLRHQTTRRWIIRPWNQQLELSATSDKFTCFSTPLTLPNNFVALYECLPKLLSPMCYSRQDLPPTHTWNTNVKTNHHFLTTGRQIRIKT